MSKIDLNTNRESLLAAHKEISNPNNKNDWVIYGYEGKSNVLKVVEKGDGGVEEMMEELNSGRIMYVYLRVQDPNTGLPKFAIINWQGEGVQELRKGSCASHFSDVRNFLRGAHLTIQARSEDDIDEDDIKNKIAKSSGSNYSFHKEAPREYTPEPGPVGSVYKKTLPHAEIKTSVRDKFWEEQQAEEKKRREEEQKKIASEKAKLDQERREREEIEARERDTREAERMKKIRQIKSAERKASASEPEDKADQEEGGGEIDAGDVSEGIGKEHIQIDAMKDSEERAKRSEMMRKERAAEARSLVQQRGNNPRNVFEQSRSQFDKPARQPPPPRKLKHSFGDEEPVHQERKKPIALPTEEPEDHRPSPSAPPPPGPGAPPPVCAPPAAAVPPPRRPPSPEEEEEEEEEEPAPVQPVKPPRAPVQPPREPSPEPEPEPEPQPVAQPASRNLLKEGLPMRQDSEDEEEENQDWEGDNEEADQAPVIPQSKAAAPAEEYEEEEQVYENTEPRAEYAREFGPDKGLVARALYDYQAADDTEITFDPDEVITNIEMIDQGWWTGIGPDGKHGMFPANYVELLNG